MTPSMPNGRRRAHGALAMALTVAAVLVSPHAHAQPAAAPDPARIAAARELMAAQGGIEQARKGLVQMTDAILAQVRRASPNEADDLAKFFAKHVSIDNPKVKSFFDDVIETSVRFYAERATVEEMKAMAAFLATPAGQRFVALAPEAAASITPRFMAFQQSLMADVQAAIQRGELGRK